MRGTATAPNSPREIAATFPSAISNTHGDSASKSNVRQTDSEPPSGTAQSNSAPPTAARRAVPRGTFDRGAARILDVERGDRHSRAMARLPDEAPSATLRRLING